MNETGLGTKTTAMMLLLQEREHAALSPRLVLRRCNRVLTGSRCPVAREAAG
jgi:hypothetical protein